MKARPGVAAPGIITRTTSPSTTTRPLATILLPPTSSKLRAGAVKEAAVEMTAIRTSNTITIMIMITTMTTTPTAGMDLLTRFERMLHLLVRHLSLASESTVASRLRTLATDNLLALNSDKPGVVGVMAS